MTDHTFPHQESSLDHLHAQWSAQVEERKGMSWADFSSDDSRSMNSEDSRSLGEAAPRSWHAAAGGAPAPQRGWGPPKPTALQQGVPAITVTDDAADGFLAPTGRPRRSEDVPADTASQQAFFELLEGNSRQGFNAAFKAGFGLSEESTDSIASDEGSNSGKRSQSVLPGLSAESQRPSKMPRLDEAATDVAQEAKAFPEASHTDAPVEPAQETTTSAAPRRQRKPRVRGQRVLTADSWAAAVSGEEGSPVVGVGSPVSVAGSPVEVATPGASPSPWGTPQPVASSWAAVADPEPRVIDVAALEAEQHQTEIAQGDAAALPVGTPARPQGDAQAEGAEDQERGRTKTREDNEHRLAQRQRQIDIGKGSEEYIAYCQMFPHGGKRKRRAKTPDKYQICSKRSFDGQISKWRRQLHSEVGHSTANGGAKAATASKAPRRSARKATAKQPSVDPFFA
jgi:Histone RNA hairpin-binding protein RNA-binding domain